MTKLSGSICDQLFRGSLGQEAEAHGPDADQESKVYAVLDGASIPDLIEHLQPHTGQYECLYRGELKPDLAAAAPYLVGLEENSDLTEWILQQGWGRHWAIFAVCPAPMPLVRRHFRAFLLVHSSEGKPLYFRYYDPRVMRTYLPTCNKEELAAIFGPVQAYVMEGEAPGSLLRFRLKNGSLVSDTKTL